MWLHCKVPNQVWPNEMDGVGVGVVSERLLQVCVSKIVLKN